MTIESAIIAVVALVGLAVLLADLLNLAQDLLNVLLQSFRVKDEAPEDDQEHLERHYRAQDEGDFNPWKRR